MSSVLSFAVPFIIVCCDHSVMIYRMFPVNVFVSDRVLVGWDKRQMFVTRHLSPHRVCHFMDGVNFRVVVNEYMYVFS